MNTWTILNKIKYSRSTLKKTTLSLLLERVPKSGKKLI